VIDSALEIGFDTYLPQPGFNARMAKLTFVLEDGQEIEVPLVERVTLGRADDNDVVVDDDRISKRHAELVLNADGSVQVFDSNSTAGTFVNGERVRSQTIRHGDRLAFGPLAAILDLEDHGANGNGSTPSAAADTRAQAIGSPVKAGRIGSRKKNRGTKKDFPSDAQTALPADEMLARQRAAAARAAAEKEQMQAEVESLKKKQTEHQEAISKLQAERDRLQKEVELLTQRQTEQREAAAGLETEKARLQAELDTARREWLDWQAQSEKERSMHNARVESLRTEEERLVPVQAAVKEAEMAHAAWIQSIMTLSAQHEEKTAALMQLTARHGEKTADLQQLVDDENSTRQELKVLATQREQTLAHLKQMREEQAHDETVLDGLRRQIAELEAHSRHCKEIADVRDDQLSVAEKKLDQLAQSRAQIEAHIQELAGTEEKLVQTLGRCREAEANHATLTADLAALEVKRQHAEKTAGELESRVAALEETRQQASAAADKAQEARQQAETSLLSVQKELATHEKDLASRSAELTDETRRLKETQAHHAEIEKQCQELAGTEQKLTGVKQRLADAEQKLGEVKASITTEEAQIVSLKSSIKDLEGLEVSAKGRIDVLHAREKDLRAELSRLATSERSERARFEEVRQLAAEAGKEHAAQEKQLASDLEAKRKELAELSSRLTPLRDWKEAMDLLYARLATLPQDSPEARDLWREIEKEKTGLHDLITAARSQALASPADQARSHPAAPAGPAAPTKPDRLTGSIPVSGRMGSGTAQETTLRARLNHLRESVQREEAHLEHLRLERARHDIHPRSSPAADAMMREQERQLEAKIRRDEEHYTSVQRKLELAGTEEEKRRERVAELERKLAELRSDITEAERHRSDLRQQADLAHTELKNYEAAIDRMTKKQPGDAL
jgi:pSer/pThr/pTyr-binding forkhead associated (FHA) protein